MHSCSGVRFGQQLIVASADADFRAKLDDRTWIEFDQDRLHLFDAKSNVALGYPSEVAPTSMAVLERNSLRQATADSRNSFLATGLSRLSLGGWHCIARPSAGRTLCSSV
jgi:hypothetical protein